MQLGISFIQDQPMLATLVGQNNAMQILAQSQDDAGRAFESIEEKVIERRPES